MKEPTKPMRMLIVSTLLVTSLAAGANESCANVPWLDWFAGRVPTGALAPAATESPLATPTEPFAASVPWLDWTARQMAFAMQEALPAEGDLEAASVAEAVVVDLPRGDEQTELARVRREMQSLRSEVRMLQATLDTFMTDVAGPLREENEQLRAEIKRIYALEEGDPQGVFPAVPRPGDDLVEEVINEAVERAVAAASSQMPVYEPQPQAPAEPEFTYTIISEYGREPDHPSVVDGEAPSLKGMVIVVPPSSHREDIVALGKELRDRFEPYDNINIEIFDETLAAQSFAETNVSTGPEHRVLSVSRHKASGRDAIIFMRDGIASEVE